MAPLQGAHLYCSKAGGVAGVQPPANSCEASGLSNSRGPVTPCVECPPLLIARLFVHNVLGQLVAEYSEQGPQGIWGRFI